MIALSSVAAFADRGQILTSLIAAVIGLMLGTIGTDPSAGVQRFTFGQLDLLDGIPFILLAMATFALAEAFRMTTDRSEGPIPSPGKNNVRLYPGDARDMVPTVSRSSVLGFLIGVLPGAGATLASFIAYDTERRLHKKANPVRGIAAPESANNAACTGSFVPLLTLGIPGSGTTAILLGVMLSYGIQPGPRLLETEPGVFWGVIVSMYIGNLILLALNLPLIPYISRVIYLSRKILIPFVIAFSMLGVYLTTMNPFDIFLMLGIGLAAFLLRSAGFPLAPLLLGFILSGMLEENLRRTLYLSEGSLTIFFQSPLSATLVTVCLIVWTIPLVRIANDLRRGGNPRD